MIAGVKIPVDMRYQNTLRSFLQVPNAISHFWVLGQKRTCTETPYKLGV